MPNDPNCSILMICTGTGSAPVPGLHRTPPSRRTRVRPGKLTMFFGARTPQELPYFGPLQKVPERLLEKHLVSRACPASPRSTCRTACAPRRQRSPTC